MKKRVLLFVAVLILATCSLTSQVAITTDGSDPDASAMLDVKSSSKGFLPPRMTLTQRSNISNPAVGLLVYQIDGSSGYYYYDGTEWVSLTSESTPESGTCIVSTSSTPPNGYTYSGNSYEVTNQWEIMESCITPRYLGATCEYNGYIYIFGGLPFYEGSALTSIEKYNAYTNTWSYIGDMLTGRTQFSVGKLNGEFYIFGGANDNGYVTTVEKFDPNSNTCSVVSSLPPLHDGFMNGVSIGIENQDAIYLSMGWVGWSTTNYAYYPNTDTWTLKASHPYDRRREASASCVFASKIYVFGGLQGGAYTSLADQYDPFTDTWSIIQDLPIEIAWGGAAELNNLIYINSDSEVPPYYNEFLEFDISAESYHVKPRISISRGSSFVTSSSNKFYVIAGRRGYDNFSTNERYSKVSGLFYYIHCVN